MKLGPGPASFCSIRWSSSRLTPRARACWGRIIYAEITRTEVKIAYESGELRVSQVEPMTLSGICVNPWCDYTATVAPDEGAGHRERDGTNTVQSDLVLADAI